MRNADFKVLLALIAPWLTASSISYGQASASFPDLTPPAHWVANQVPFSFKYDGKDSAQFLGSWQCSNENVPECGGARLHRYIYTDPATRLKVTAEVRTFPDNPAAIDWVLRFRNDGPKDTPILENILPLHWTAPGAGDYIVRHARGSNAAANDFEPLEERFGAWDDHLESSNGRSSDGPTLPFFNLQSGDHGLIGAIGWTGNWMADIVTTNGPSSQITITAGMKRTHLLLHPGEEIRTPRIVLLNWTGGDWQASQNLWRRLVFAHYSPRENGKPMRGNLIYGGGHNLEDMLPLIKWIHDHQFPLDYWAIDAGWYGDMRQGTNADTFWWMNRGNWYPDPQNFAGGLKPIGDALKADGYGFSLWVEPETAMPGTKIVTEHPDWYLHSNHPVNPGVMLANLGKPQVREALTDMVSGFITDYRMTWYRQDFNIPPEEYWALADTPDRIGMTEILHIEGLYRMWDDLLAKHPGLHIDNCSSGGRRIDIEMMTRSYVVWRTDLGTHDTLAEQAQTQALDPWDPLNSSFESFTETKPWKHPGPYSTPQTLYLMRLGYNTGYCLTPGETGLENDEWVAWVKKAAAEFREVQPYFYGDFHPLVPYSLADDNWTLWQWERPEQKDGLVIALRRPSSPFASVQLPLHHIDPDAQYAVEIRPTYEKALVQRMKGAALLNLQVTLPDRPGSTLVFYKKM